MENKYCIGLDIGTTSVGWAVVDTNNNEIIKRKVYRNKINLITGEKKHKNQMKALWGVRLFEEATKADERRLKRGQRRRYDRRRKRIQLLQNEFNSEIKKVDPLFFEKLKTSFYSPLDEKNRKINLTEYDKKEIFSNNKLINNKNNYIDKKKYPTIYHLRNELINSKEKKDIRLVYLAIHHIIKYRGNFLYQNNNFKIENIDIKEKLENVFNNLFELNGDTFDFNKIEEAIFEVSKKDSEIRLKEILKGTIEPVKANELVKLLMGNKFNLIKLFDIEKDENLIESISFNGSNYDDNYQQLETMLNDKIDILEELKELYDIIFIKKMFKGSTSTSISELMIEKYNKHKEDLKKLKSIVRQNKNDYKKIFKTKKEKCLYDKYINNNIEYNEFIKEIRKILEKLNNTEVLIDIENGTFMPRVTSTENGKYPYQFNKEELIKIIDNQSKYYDFLKEAKERIIKLLEFRIPYYVGPLNTQTSNPNIKNPNAWLVKKEKYKNVPITPFNFDEVINKERTAEEFIERMLSKCTYLNNEKAMPKNSILYSQYKVIGELKQISVNNQKLTKEQIADIFNDLFLKNETVTKNLLENYLKQHNDFKFINDFEINGFQTENKFASNMKSFIDFFTQDGIFAHTDYKNEDAENIIRYITIFEDKVLLKEKLIIEYKQLDQNAINKICKLKYKGWSSLSKKLLTEIYTKEHKNIMDLLIETNENFMQIINNEDYHLQEEIDKINKIQKNKKITYKLVEELATSPANKRGIYQALKIVEEIVDYMKCEPEYISIEMARGEEEKKRTSSRKEQIKKKYEAIKGQINNYKELNKELNELNDEEFTDKIFLYFIQLGKSLYSGKSLNINDLSNCDIDHILPQTLIKDDSIENKALVLKEENAKKRDSLVVPEEYQNKMNGWWKYLQKCNLLTNKKLFALTRKEYKKEQIEGFINRQLVETRQITKHVANILKNYYNKTKIIYLHANLSHNYRQKFNLYKFRDLNDYHHAHDAYLAAVLGMYKENYVNKDIDFSELKTLSQKLYENKNYKELKYGYVINGLDNNIRNINLKTGVVHNNKEFNDLVEKTLYRNDIIISKKTEIRTGKFYDETKNSKGKSGVRLKKNLDTNIYGSYTGINPSYAVIAKYNNKGQIEQKMVGIPILIDMYKDQKQLDYYIKKTYKLDVVGYVLDINKNILKISFYTKFNWNGQICMLVGANEKVEVCNAKEFKIEKDKMEKWKSTLNILLNRNGKIPKDYSIIKYNEELKEILNYIKEKMITKYNLYFNLTEEIKKIINDSMDNLENTEKAIKELLNLLKVNSTNANFKHINHSSSFGRKNNRTITNAVIINQSVTGLKEVDYEF